MSANRLIRALNYSFKAADKIVDLPSFFSVLPDVIILCFRTVRLGTPYLSAAVRCDMPRSMADSADFKRYSSHIARFLVYGMICDNKVIIIFPVLFHSDFFNEIKTKQT